MTEAKFKATIWKQYEVLGRHSLPWRHTRDPYRILVSEVMLQQTQVSRVLKKYEEFLKEFPDTESLAQAPVSKLLSVWKGLGYSRRALNLKRAAETIVREYGGRFPRDAASLEALPGVGQSTRGAVMASAFGMPTVFIETNIRAAFIHCFFEDRSGIHDREILPLIEKTLPDKSAPKGRGVRDWYYALMDYGAHLKLSLPNPSRRSAHHAQQSPFKGSNRELRSHMLDLLMNGPLSESDAISHFKKKGKDPGQILKNLRDLEKEGFISRKRNMLGIA